MSKFFKMLSEYKTIILFPLIIILIIIAIFQIYEIRHRYYITAKFSESGPLYKNMPVYYKGYNIGKTENIKPSEDYKYTFAKIMLYPQNPKLPDNVVAKVKNHNVRKEYIDLIVSDSSSANLLKNGSTIDGERAFDLEEFLSDIADSGLIVPLIQTFSDTLINFGKTSTEIKNFFTDSRSVIKDNKQNINQTTKDLALTTKSFKKMGSRLNNSITDEKLDSTTTSVVKSSTNIKAATESIKNIAASVDCATRNLDKTMAKVDCTISEANATLSNAKVITGGFCKVLGKRFAGLRIIFGKPLKNNACSNNCSR